MMAVTWVASSVEKTVFLKAAQMADMTVAHWDWCSAAWRVAQKADSKVV